ncbi:formate dehydrogenase subunit alpha [Rhodopseudomonas palustris]|uniref:formate dehydrogenase subunit alpha n=1 Tax=Rhodopseudomonas palustris TaxID=1076 RepID=UPI0020CCB38C|nr:formate dehydrogenase subunit alpha [Rhodopseudomonas palustris]MCP9630387.1 formate dehydrogenase subunit alpha [Rhodopseudomonas palustris]
MNQAPTDAVVSFNLDGEAVEARPGERIIDTALRLGHAIPHQCCQPMSDLPRPGRCRSCLVEVEGERQFKASCRELPRAGQSILTESPRLTSYRQTLAALQPEPIALAKDDSHAAIGFDPDQCIACGLCVTACRDVQCHEVIGLAGRGADIHIVFDYEATLGASSCASCGQCVQACPTGALSSRAYRPIAAAPLHAEERVTEAVCPYCCVGCRIEVHARDERVVEIRALDGPTNHSRLCVKGRFGQDFIHHADRLTTPLIRLAGAPKGELSADWRASFRAASWDEAVDFAASGLRRAHAAHGPGSLAFFGSLKTCNEDSYLFQKLARAAFGTNNVDHPTRLCHASSTAALLESVGTGAPSSQIGECANADVIFVIGANPSTSHPVAGSLLRNAVRNGAKLIVVDPRGQPLDRFASHVVRFKPGTDVVLLGAMLGVIITEQRYNRDFIAARVDGFEEIERMASQFPLPLAAAICGVPPELIAEVARVYAGASAAMTIWGMGMTQHSHGTDNIRCLIAMALICGQVGRPGTGLYPIRGHNNAQGAPDSGMLPNYFPDYQPADAADVREKFAALWGVPISDTPGLTMIEVVDAVHAGSVRALYAHGANPAMCMPGSGHVREALARLDHLVVQDIFPTETAAYADVILPAAALLEKEGTLTNIDRRIQHTRAAVRPPGEAKPDWWIVQEIARRCGQHWDYAGPAEIFDEMRRSMPSIGGITWDRLLQTGAVQYPCRAEGDPETALLFSERFHTANGRACLVPPDTAAPASITSAEFPLVMTTGRLLEHHTGPMSRRAGVLSAIEPDPFVGMNPVDMERLSLRSGDAVTVRSREGAIDTYVRADDALPEGLVFAPYCFTEGPANALVTPLMDPISKTADMKVSAVVVSRRCTHPSLHTPVALTI